jgi:hypothetical protein
MERRVAEWPWLSGTSISVYCEPCIKFLWGYEVSSEVNADIYKHMPVYIPAFFYKSGFEA